MTGFPSLDFRQGDGGRITKKLRVMTRTTCRSIVHGLTRRAALPLLAAGLASAALAGDAPVAAPAPAGAWRLVYVGADDCAPCRAWRQAEWARLRASARFAAFAFHEVRAPRSADLLRDEHWPDPLRPYRVAIPAAAGAPFWLLLHQDEVVLRAWGKPQWRATMLPAMRRAARGALHPGLITQDPRTGRRDV
ncbi:MAG: hypothetical protein IT557_13040 [Alphaproteobacteria bacterium]|nr:hypothetical protein [Alphaproteobacteria bacterium]